MNNKMTPNRNAKIFFQKVISAVYKIKIDKYDPHLHF